VSENGEIPKRQGLLVVFELRPVSSLAREITRLLQRSGKYQVELCSEDAALQGNLKPDLLLPVFRQNDGCRQKAMLEALSGKTFFPLLPVVEEGGLGTLLEQGDLGARDFLVAPLREVEVFGRIERVLRGDNLCERVSEICGVAQLIGESPALVELRHKIALVAGFGSTVLLTGETGTGKERCARALHHSSCRADKPFLPVNCGAIPVELFESELYGHQRGAFTGAMAAQTGLIGEANGGTLFLDEIETLSTASQVKLLRFLQDQTYYPVGSSRQKQADVWIIASTNVDLLREAKAGSFRQDLYYRLAVINLILSPLRERRSDIAPLAQHFLKLYAEKHCRPERQFSPQAMQTLREYDWPGNVRELENMVQQVMALTEASVIDSQDLALPHKNVASDSGQTFQQCKAEAISRFEKQYVVDLLRAHHGNITRAALAAGKERRALGRLIKKYHLRHEHGALPASA